MKKILWLKEKVGYIPGAVNLGVVRFGKKALLIDTGLTPRAAKEALKLLSQEGLELTYIFNTHSHADHCGGNAFLQKRVEGLTVLAPEGEAAVIENPFWEPVYLYGGAVPFSELKVPFLSAPPSEVNMRVLPGKMILEDEEIEFLDLSGHSPAQTGLLIDGVLFSADVIFSPELWEKHRFVYFFDLDASRKTMKRLEKMEVDYFVPAHAEVVQNMKGMVQLNLRKMDEFEEKVKSVLAEGKASVEEILKAIVGREKVKFSNVPSYLLALATVRAYLTSLVEKREVRFSLEDVLYWELVK